MRQWILLALLALPATAAAQEGNAVNAEILVTLQQMQRSIDNLNASITSRTQLPPPVVVPAAELGCEFAIPAQRTITLPTQRTITLPEQSTRSILLERPTIRETTTDTQIEIGFLDKLLHRVRTYSIGGSEVRVVPCFLRSRIEVR